jgi:DNA-directed RNA polymerase specialized sigma24 family protein
MAIRWHRILGSRADAEDAVQDCFLKWRDADRSEIRTPAAWLSSVCTRRCLDILRAADRARVNYVGPGFPSRSTPQRREPSFLQAASSISNIESRLLRAFQSAVMSGNTTQLSALLSTDIRLTTDTGGKVVAATRVLEAEDVLSALSRAHIWWEGYRWEITDINGGRGAILTKSGQPALTITLACDEAGLVTDIFIVLNPDKLARLGTVDIH